MRTFLVLAALLAQPALAYEVGVNTHLPCNNATDPCPALDRAVEMRLTWARMDFRWDIVEPTPMDDVATQGNWGIFDGSVAQARSRGIQVLPIIQAPPGWATIGGVEDSPLTATGEEHYVRYVTAVAQRFRGLVDHYEIFNEPNLGAKWNDKVNVYVDQLLIPGREAIKAVDPNFKVAGPALASNMVATVKLEDFIKQLGVRQKKYGQRFFDIITQHAYNNTSQGVIDDMAKGRQFCIWFLCFPTRDPIVTIYAKNGFDQEPIWLDEYGWVAGAAEADQENQAKLLLDTTEKLGQIPRLEVGMIYHISDDPRSTPDFGILFSDMTPKKAYDALRNRP